jgi:ribosomal protein S26
MSSWGDAKRQRGAELNYRCEVCGAYTPVRDAVGHHKTYKRDKGRSEKRNLEYRCLPCERSDPHQSPIKRGKKSQDFNDEMRTWRHYCRTGRLPNWR